MSRGRDARGRNFWFEPNQFLVEFGQQVRRCDRRGFRRHPIRVINNLSHISRIRRPHRGQNNRRVLGRHINRSMQKFSVLLIQLVRQRLSFFL